LCYCIRVKSLFTRVWYDSVTNYRQLISSGTIITYYERKYIWELYFVFNRMIIISAKFNVNIHRDSWCVYVLIAISFFLRTDFRGQVVRPNGMDDSRVRRFIYVWRCEWYSTNEFEVKNNIIIWKREIISFLSSQLNINRNKLFSWWTGTFFNADENITNRYLFEIRNVIITNILYQLIYSLYFFLHKTF